MFAAALPAPNPELLQRRLYERFRIEVLVNRWADRGLIRPSFQAHNDVADANLLVGALQELLPCAPGREVV